MGFFLPAKNAGRIALSLKKYKILDIVLEKNGENDTMKKEWKGVDLFYRRRAADFWDKI